MIDNILFVSGVVVTVVILCLFLFAWVVLLINVTYEFIIEEGFHVFRKSASKRAVPHDSVGRQGREDR